MTNSLENQVVWITGSSRGLGREMAVELSRQGALVAVHGTRENSPSTFDEGTTMQDLAASFNAARAVNQTAVLSQELRYEPTTMTPDKMLLMESANYSALECGSRIGNVPPYLIGVSTGSYSYQSSQQARADLYIFGVKLYAEAISATLSMNNVLPSGTFVEFDAEGYLEENYIADEMDQEQPRTGEEIAS